MGKKCYVRLESETGLFVAFDAKSGESVTGYQLSENQLTVFQETDRIGNDYSKGNNSNNGNN